MMPSFSRGNLWTPPNQGRMTKALSRAAERFPRWRIPAAPPGSARARYPPPAPAPFRPQAPPCGRRVLLATAVGTWRCARPGKWEATLGRRRAAGRVRAHRWEQLEKSGKSRRAVFFAAAVEGDPAALADALGFQGPRSVGAAAGPVTAPRRRPSTAGGCGGLKAVGGISRWVLGSQPTPATPGPTAGGATPPGCLALPVATLHPDPWPQGLDQYRSSPGRSKTVLFLLSIRLHPLSISPWPRWLQLVYFPKKSQCVRLALSRGNPKVRRNSLHPPPPNTWPAPAMQHC